MPELVLDEAFLENPALRGLYVRQKRIGPYLADFAFPKAKIVVEADGPLHRRPERRQWDEVRDVYMRALGWTVLRYTDERIMREPCSIAREVAEHVRRAREHVAR